MFSRSLLLHARRLPSSRFASTLILVEPSGSSSLAAGTLNVVTAAQQLGHPISYIVPAPDSNSVKSILDQLQSFSPHKIIVATNPTLHSHPTCAELIAPLIVSAIKSIQATHILSPTSAFAKNILPRVAAILDVQAVSDVVTILDPDTFTRPIYAGNALATIKSKDPIKIITIRPTAFTAASPNSTTNNINVESIADDKQFTGPHSTLIDEQLVKSDRPTLDSAKVIVAGGRALKSSDNFKILYDLADKLGGTVGASRAAVDAGYVDNSLQIGQTGKVVAPQLYIGCGISGAIQHLAGMKDSKVIVAINKDPEAPIFQVADYGLEADLFTAVPEMTSKL